MADSLYQSLVMFFVTMAAYQNEEVGIWEFGTSLTSTCLFVNLIHAGVETKSWVSPTVKLKISNKITDQHVISDHNSRDGHLRLAFWILLFLLHLQLVLRQLFRPAEHILGGS